MNTLKITVDPIKDMKIEKYHSCYTKTCSKYIANFIGIYNV